MSLLLVLLLLSALLPVVFEYVVVVRDYNVGVGEDVVV